MRLVILSLSLVLFCSTLGAQPKQKAEKDSIFQNTAITNGTPLKSQSTKLYVENGKDCDVAMIKNNTCAIKKNTNHNWCLDGWTLFGLFSFIVASCSAFYTYLTYGEQRTTKRNTQKLSQELQRYLLNDLLRHLYRNYVITYAMRTKMDDISYDGYPSEEHYEKLKIPMENIHLESFYGDSDKFQVLHVLYLNLRNYNEEVAVALNHVINPQIKREIVDEDFDTLEFKISFLTKKIIDAITEIWGNQDAYKEEMRKALNLSLSGATNATDNINVINSRLFKHVTYKNFSKTAYSVLFDDEELKKVCDIFNNDVCEERKKNSRGAWKVRIIPFIEGKGRIEGNPAHPTEVQ